MLLNDILIMAMGNAFLPHFTKPWRHMVPVTGVLKSVISTCVYSTCVAKLPLPGSRSQRGV